MRFTSAAEYTILDIQFNTNRFTCHKHVIVNLVLKRELLVDNLSKEKRGRVMASIRGKDTEPEITIRKLLWKEGVRYRIHNKSIYGTPDISIKTDRIAIFIDGCFWHGCKRCYKEPKSNVGFWRKKILDNRKRRIKVRSQLRRGGWNVQEFWEHQVNSRPQDVINSIMQNL